MLKLNLPRYLLKITTVSELLQSVLRGLNTYAGTWVGYGTKKRSAGILSALRTILGSGF